MATGNVIVNFGFDGSRIRHAMRRSLIAAGIPLHRNDRAVDACSLLIDEPFRSENECTHAGMGCADYPARHRADGAA